MKENVFLKKGDIIDIIAPSSYFHNDLNSIKSFIEKLGFQANINVFMYEKNSDPFSANSDEIRAELLIRAVESELSKAIWCIRGGYGSSRLLPLIDKYSLKGKQKKLLIGYSDATALHMYFIKKFGWITIHGRNVGNCIDGKISDLELNNLQDLLFGKLANLHYDLTPGNEEARKTIKIEGKAVGGNLSMLVCGLSTPWCFNTKGKIVFIEEVGEKGYKIDRDLCHLKQAGFFKKIAALVLGSVNCVKEPGSNKNLCNFALSRLARELEVPVFFSNEFGHGYVNNPILMNRQYVIDSYKPRVSYILSCS